MKCEDAQKQFDDLLLGELEPDIEIEVNTHLDECAECRRVWREHEKSIQELTTTTTFEPLPSAYQRIQANVVSSNRKSRFLWIFPKQVVYTLGAFLLGIVIMRVVDAIVAKKPDESQVEIHRVPAYQEPSTDTVQFYTAPAKHLARS